MRNKTCELDSLFDVLVIGGGINGCGIARDAQGRGYKVMLVEMNDLASATSSASTKLFHGGLRYLEYFEFRLVREALIEREILYSNMPHISWPMRFVLPVHASMRFTNSTPTSRLIGTFMPWLKGKRPTWLIRLGLFIYDHIGDRKLLPGTKKLDLSREPEGVPLKPKFRKAYEYSDCWIEDARLVVLNARDAQRKGATIMTRTKVVEIQCTDNVWAITLETPEKRMIVHTKMLVNAAGPWVAELASKTAQLKLRETVRLVRGSHIVVDRLYNHDKAYVFQGNDGRIIFSIPYENDFTLIGTTDADHPNPSSTPVCSSEEAKYLCDFASQYFNQALTRDDIVWSFSGVRALYDDGASSASAATRDYVLKLDASKGAPILNVFGGKITTFRKLAESAVELIDKAFARHTTPWTHNAPLPGGEFKIDQKQDLIESLANKLSFLERKAIDRLFRQYGAEAALIFKNANSLDDLGGEIAHSVTARELDWAVEKEWVRCAEDFIWRRSKLGLQLSNTEITAIERYIEARLIKHATPV